jgi:alkaline phosphatase
LNRTIGAWHNADFKRSALNMLSKFSRRYVWLVLLLAAASTGCAQQPQPVRQPRNVILFIGDGMGVGQIQSARDYLGHPLVFETLAHRGKMTTRSASSEVTDSAAASTAMATGYKVNNGVLSLAFPANADYAAGAALPTVLEEMQRRGKSTGLVTTDVMTGATPAGFAAHQNSRGNTEAIAKDYFTRVRPTLLLGGAGKGVSPAAARAAGYRVVTNRQESQAAALENDKTVPSISGQFGTGLMPYEYDESEGYRTLPHLSEMTAAALKILDRDPNGFFVMIEGERIDTACHQNALERSVGETIEFNRAVETALAWAAKRTDTLIVITADHETGGLKVIKDNGPGQYPAVTWTSKNHSGAPVPIEAKGLGEEAIADMQDNTQLHAILLDPAAVAQKVKEEHPPAAAVRRVEAAPAPSR